jgi:hypothetical protein
MSVGCLLLLAFPGLTVRTATFLLPCRRRFASDIGFAIVAAIVATILLTMVTALVATVVTAPDILPPCLRGLGFAGLYDLPPLSPVRS